MKRTSAILLTLFFAVNLWSQGRIDADMEVVNIENRAVQDYMRDADSTYTANHDYRVSVITKYNNTQKYGTKLYWPGGKHVTWTPTTVPDSILEIRIYASEKPDYSDAYTFNPDKNSVDVDSYIIRNLLPNRVYYYKVEEILKNGTVNIVASDAFRTVGQVRMIQVRNNSNVRDIGGWPTQYGRPVKYGRLFRSGSLERITKQGKHDFVDNLGVVAELDLRGESKRTTSCLGSDKAYLRISHGMYSEGLTKRSSLYAKDLRWILDKLNNGMNVDWHCAIGCDRCGTLSFLIEGLLGMNEKDICRDYELSTLSLSSKNRRVRSSLKSLFNIVKKYGPDDDLARCFYNYWLHIGMTRDELNDFISEMTGIANVAELTAEPQESHNN